MTFVSAKKIGCLFLSTLAVVITTSSFSYAVVVIRDGFGDGDRNNDGIAFSDDDVTGDVYSTYEPFIDEDTTLRLDDPLIFPAGTMINAPTTADDPTDRGIRWLTTGGFGSSFMGDVASVPRIVDDSAGVQPETTAITPQNPDNGFFNSIPGVRQTTPALNSGLALSVQARGRGRTSTGFFETDLDYSNGKQGTISLGPEIDDEVKVSFDFRIWMSATGFNDNSGTNHVTDYGQLRFGIYQDTDNQLGMENEFAGPGDIMVNPPVFETRTWGEEDGLFRGDTGGPDASGDAGWNVRLPLKDAASAADPFISEGPVARIIEETNLDGPGDRALEQGTQQTVAGDLLNSQNVGTLENTKRYHIEFSLKRFEDPTGTASAPGEGNNIEATVTVTNMDDSNDTFDMTGFNALDLLGDEAGFDSDSWDYFTMGVFSAGVEAQDFDFLMDNFTVEVIGSNSPDTEPDGDVDGADFLNLQRNNPAAIANWQRTFGSGGGALAAASVVPEPASILSLCLGGLLALGGARRTR